MTFEELLERQRALTAEIDARLDGTPNLREYGFARRDEFEADLARYHAETERLRAERNDVALQRIAARKALTHNA